MRTSTSGVADHAACRGGVGRELEHGGIERRIVGPEVAVALAGTGLVVGDDDRPGGGAIDAIDGAAEVQCPSRHRATTRPAHSGVVAEPLLGGEDGDAPFDRQLAVAFEPAEQVGAHPVTLVGPVGGATGAPSSLGEPALVVEHRRQRVAVLVGPPVRGRLRQLAGDHRPVEPVECPVLGGADVGGRDADLIGRFVDRE